ncbi:MAG: hypothetical protein JXA77_16835 [Bacteroidales bacterium]|nr:hypothetical protein [Bacteroidales bacterium]MBN2819367.1 hypothetical protein [Bacteroidales bacterium]
MPSKVAFLLPVISLFYFFQTAFRRQIKIYIRLPLAMVAFVVVLFDLFVSLVFYFNCLDLGNRLGTQNCINSIYPTLDFMLMIFFSMGLLLAATFELRKSWKLKNYAFSTLVIYIGVLFRLFVLVGAAEAISLTGAASSPIVFEVFSVVVVYGLVSAVIYLMIYSVGFLKPQTPPQ